MKHYIIIHMYPFQMFYKIISKGICTNSCYCHELTRDSMHFVMTIIDIVGRVMWFLLW